jgi:hypothetical protein
MGVRLLAVVGILHHSEASIPTMELTHSPILRACPLFPHSIAAGSSNLPSRPFSSKVKNAWSYSSTVPYNFMACCLIKHFDNFASYPQN